jgi:hypothetical protein
MSRVQTLVPTVVPQQDSNPGTNPAIVARGFPKPLPKSNPNPLGTVADITPFEPGTTGLSAQEAIPNHDSSHVGEFQTNSNTPDLHYVVEPEAAQNTQNAGASSESTAQTAGAKRPFKSTPFTTGQGPYTKGEAGDSARAARLGELRPFGALVHLFKAGSKALDTKDFAAFAGKLARYAPLLIQFVAKESPWGAAAVAAIKVIDPKGEKFEQWTRRGTDIAKDAIDHFRTPKEERSAERGERIKKEANFLLRDVASHTATLENAIKLVGKMDFAPKA